MLNQTEANKATMKRLYEEQWNQGNLKVTGEIFSKPASVKRYVTAFRQSFPDIKHTVLEMMAEGDKVVAHFMAEGTHQGHWLNMPPTNKEFRFEGVTMARFKEGKIIEHQTIWDMALVFEQLGMIEVFRTAGGGRS